MMMRAPKALRTLALVVAAGAMAAGCGGSRRAVGDALGLTIDSPNPFNVAPTAPLSLPGDLSYLPPPNPGERSPLEPRPEQAARAALADAGSPPPDAAAPSPGELALLDAAGAENATPQIRTELAEDAKNRNNDSYGLTYLFGYKVPDGSEKEVLDSREAADKTRAEGAPTPTPAPLPAGEGPSSASYSLPVDL